MFGPVGHVVKLVVVLVVVGHIPVLVTGAGAGAGAPLSTTDGLSGPQSHLLSGPSSSGAATALRNLNED